MNLGTAQVIRANARHLPLADDSVDLVVTSPPYFALRSYQDGGEHYAGQIGDEPTPAEFVASLLEVTRECVRVLKPSGSLWVNLGDKYASSGGHGAGATSQRATRSQYVEQVGRSERNTTGVATKSLIGIPWRYALACIDELGLILRAEVIWSKPNGLPESVTDRVRRSHEQWFHFTLSPRYFSAVDEIREAHLFPMQSRTMGDSANGGKHSGERHKRQDGAANPLGKLPGSVWTVPTEPLRVPDHLGIDHFAAFPTEWPKRIIRGWSPAGVCVECGEGRRPVVVKGKADAYTTNQKRTGRHDLHDDGARGVFGKAGPREFYRETATITGYACACGQFGPGDCASCGEPATTSVSHGGTSVPACLRHYNHWRTPTRPAVVLDPFGGTGTTAMVAKALGRHGISVDMSADYCRLAEWRTNDRNQLAKVLGVDKAPEADAAQLDLFDGEAS